MVKKKRFDQAHLKSTAFDDLCIFINTLENSLIMHKGYSILRIFLGLTNRFSQCYLNQTFV